VLLTLVVMAGLMTVLTGLVLVVQLAWALARWGWRRLRAQAHVCYSVPAGVAARNWHVWLPAAEEAPWDAAVDETLARMR